jgi:hypothetical protein
MYKVTFSLEGEAEDINIGDFFIDENGLKVFEDTINDDLIMLNSLMQPK